MATSPEELAPGVYRIDAFRLARMVNVFAIHADDGWTLVDTGLGGSPARIQAALGRLGVGPAALRRIYLTHHHSDHIAGLPGMCRWAPEAEVVASEREAEIISGARPRDAAPSPVSRLMQRADRLPVVPVSRTVIEGEIVAGFRVIATPGHSVGHTSLLSEDHGLLLTGDAFGALPRRLRVGVRGALCADPAMALRSADKLLEEEYATVAFSHGAVLREAARERLREVVAACDYGR